MPRVSLCSYTYNDPELLHGLLASLPGWSVQPDEIVLMDDGSDQPFELLESERGLPIRLLRHKENQGFTKAKHDCISVAGGEFILALDCDARVSPDFLELCLKLLQEESIGLVGGAQAAPPYDDYTSWYAYAFSFGTAQPAREAGNREGERSHEEILAEALSRAGDTKFVNGGAFALRRKVWEEVGGFNDFPKDLLEDSYLSNVVRERGYLLTRLCSPVDMERRVSREALCRRYWKWGCGYGWLESVVASGQSLPSTLAKFKENMLSRCASIRKEELTPVFYYYELLIMCHTMLEFCNSLGSQGKLPPDAGKNLLAGLQERLAGFPKLWMLLKSDLLKARALPPRPVLPPSENDRSDLATRCDWSDLLSFFERFRAEGILDYLEREGVGLILQDERETPIDFSSY